MHLLKHVISVINYVGNMSTACQFFSKDSLGAEGENTVAHSKLFRLGNKFCIPIIWLHLKLQLVSTKIGKQYCCLLSLEIVHVLPWIVLFLLMKYTLLVVCIPYAALLKIIMILVHNQKLHWESFWRSCWKRICKQSHLASYFLFARLGKRYLVLKAGEKERQTIKSSEDIGRCWGRRSWVYHGAEAE